MTVVENQSGMSKSADKSATRSTLKANLFRGPRLRVIAVAPKTSWWIVGAAPSDRDQFIAAARQRALDVWSNALPTAKNRT